MEDVMIPARDGLELVGYLTRAKTEGPSPLILLVHGGPWARDYWGFDARCQWFANRGYSTLKVRIDPAYNTLMMLIHISYFFSI